MSDVRSFNPNPRVRIFKEDDGSSVVIIMGDDSLEFRSLENPKGFLEELMKEITQTLKEFE